MAVLVLSAASFGWDLLWCSCESVGAHYGGSRCRGNNRGELQTRAMVRDYQDVQPFIPFATAATFLLPLHLAKRALARTTISQHAVLFVMRDRRARCRTQARRRIFLVHTCIHLSGGSEAWKKCGCDAAINGRACHDLHTWDTTPHLIWAGSGTRVCKGVPA